VSTSTSTATEAAALVAVSIDNDHDDLKSAEHARQVALAMHYARVENEEIQSIVNKIVLDVIAQAAEKLELPLSSVISSQETLIKPQLHSYNAQAILEESASNPLETREVSSSSHSLAEGPSVESVVSAPSAAVTTVRAEETPHHKYDTLASSSSSASKRGGAKTAIKQKEPAVDCFPCSIV